MIEIIFYILLFIVIIIILGLLSELFKPLDFLIKNIVFNIYKFGKSVGKSIKNILKDGDKNE